MTQPFQNLLRSVNEVYQHTDLLGFPAIALRAVRALIVQDMAGYTEVDFSTGRVTATTDSLEFQSEAIGRALEPYVNVHPLIRHSNKTGDNTAHRITDFVTQERFERSQLYQVVYKPIRVRRQMSVAIMTPELVLVGLISNRGGRDFSERDRTLLNLFRPHLVQAYENARIFGRVQRHQQQLDQIARSKRYGVIITTAAGKIDAIMGTASELLRHFFDTPKTPGRLPEVLQAWMSERLKDTLSLSPRQPLFIYHANEQISIRLLTAVSGLYHTLVMEPTMTELPTEPLQAAGITLREIDVLRGVSQGNSNAEIAEALHVRPKTIQKHLEHIYAKLQVQTRGAAAAKARALTTETAQI